MDTTLKLKICLIKNLNETSSPQERSVLIYKWGYKLIL